MDLTKLFSAQKVLMDRIEKEHPQQPGEDRFSKRILALLVEVGECANEWRGFKFWSKNQAPNAALLEEYVDGLHFVLELGILLEDTTGNTFTEHLEGVSVVRCFAYIFESATDVWASISAEDCEYSTSRCFESLLGSYLKLGNLLGFTWDEIETAYFDKNQINHTRQDNNY